MEPALAAAELKAAELKAAELKAAKLKAAELKAAEPKAAELKAELQGDLDRNCFFCGAGRKTNPTMTAYLFTYV